jgi:hypothetical protein
MRGERDYGLTSAEHTVWNNKRLTAQPVDELRRAQYRYFGSDSQKLSSCVQDPLSVSQKWCCDCHNVASSRRLDWQSPDGIHLGFTQDISKFVWEPIWYFEKGAKTPIDTRKKGRWMGFAHQSGDSFSYYIRTEKDGPSRDVILIRRDIKTRRKHIETATEYVNDDVNHADFLLKKT